MLFTFSLFTKIRLTGFGDTEYSISIHNVVYCFCREDVFSGRTYQHADISFEQAGILYNIGALHSILGAVDNRQSPEVKNMRKLHTIGGSVENT